MGQVRCAQSVPRLRRGQGRSGGAIRRPNRFGRRSACERAEPQSHASASAWPAVPSSVLARPRGLQRETRVAGKAGAPSEAGHASKGGLVVRPRIAELFGRGLSLRRWNSGAVGADAGANSGCPSSSSISAARSATTPATAHPGRAVAATCSLRRGTGAWPITPGRLQWRHRVDASETAPPTDRNVCAR